MPKKAAAAGGNAESKDEDLGALLGSAVRLPKRLEGCAYDVSGRCWVPRHYLGHVPPPRRLTLLRGFAYQVEKARSGASSCKRCGEKIEKASVRIGYPNRDQRGEFGALVIWFHRTCAREFEALVEYARGGDRAMRQRVLGFDALAKAERLQLCDDLVRPPDDAEERERAIMAQPPAVAPPRQLQAHPAPTALRVGLLPFQAEGLGWMLAREADPATRGGVLADEMGMGKTLQTIALLVASQAVGPTLVVCPAPAILQWRNEILRFTKEGSLKVHLYYGTERNALEFDTRERTVVLTTYQTLESEYRREVNKHKVACQWCQRLFLPGKLKYHLKYYCGPEAQRTEKQAKQDRKASLKNEAVKMMKIGGTETNIVLNPLNAMRASAANAARKRASKGATPPKQPTGDNAENPTDGNAESPLGEYKVTHKGITAVTVDMARASQKIAELRQGAVVRVLEVVHSEADQRVRGRIEEPKGWISVKNVTSGYHWVERIQAEGPELTDGGGEEAQAAGPMPMPFPVGVLPEEAKRALGHGSARGRGGSADAASTPAARGRGKKRAKAGEDRVKEGAETPAPATGDSPDCGAIDTPPRGPAPASTSRSKAWSRHALKAAASPPQSTPLAPTVIPAISSWGGSLRAAGAKRAISLEEDLDSGSDLELVGESGCAAEAFWGHRTNSAETDGGGDASSPVAEKEKEAEADGGLPPRPESDEDNEDDDEDGLRRSTHDIDLSKSRLFNVMWTRVVLDEAHRIKGRTNSTAQAAFALRTKAARWCLSGTPLQNRVGEMYSLIRFLKFYPYAHYFCSKRGCNCCSLKYQFDPDTSLCRKCGHTKMMHRSHFASMVSTPIKNFGFLGAGKTAMERLRTDVLDRILLRRTKQERQADINLPPLEIKIRKDSLSAEERDFYTSMYMQSRTEFDTYVDKGTLLHNYAHVFDLIMRLRQAVDHPYLIVHGDMRTERGPIPTQSRGASDVCALCQDDVDDAANRVIAQCGHTFHRDCVSEYLDQAPELPSGGIGCPSCFNPLTLSLEDGGGGADEDEEAAAATSAPASTKATGIMSKIKAAEFKTSTKIEAVLQEIRRMAAANSTSKALVFSQFTRFLELIEWRLKREGVSCAKLLGNMSIASRNNIVISYQTDPTLQVLLISLKAGGEGVNLQAADHIFIMDPWWNPASELQAIQRAHRIGQTRPVYATRFVAVDTIEEKIVELQQKKQSVFDCTVGGSNQALARLTAEDIKFLFNQ